MKWLQKLLGIDELRRRIEEQTSVLGTLNQRIASINDLKGHMVASNRGMGRLIAKLDPTYSQDELDPSRKKASDDIADQVMRKLIGEHVASNRTGSI